jgi:hypothetical protein
MIRSSNKRFICIVGSLVTATTLVSCANRDNADETPQQTAAPSISEIAPIPFATWNGEGIEAINPISMKATPDADTMMSLSACECAPGLNAKFFAISALTRGVLPQVLVPTVRQKIATNSTLELLRRLPPGLASLMTGLFADDDAIYTQVRDGLQAMLAKSLASTGGTSLHLRMPYRFDLFTSSVISPAGYPVAFDVKNQAARWNLVMATNAMWKNAIPVDGVDHGLQLLETTRVVAEWAYMAGIGRDGAPDGYGGLAASIEQPAGNMAQPENPETTSDTWGIYTSGRYSVGYPNASSLDLATRVKEMWTVEVDGVSLEEQATASRAAALAFAKMRADRLGEAERLFSNPDGALSPSMAKLPLVWLPAMATMLSQKYLDKETLTIQEYAFPKEGQQRKASLRSLLRAAQALQEWRLATRDIEGANLTESLNKRLAPLNEDLVMPLQLITRTILNRFTAINTTNGEIWVMPTKEDGTVETDPLIIAELISTLATLDQALFVSPELKDRVTSMYHWYAKYVLMPKMTGFDYLTAPQVLWNVKAADVMGNYQNAAPWISSLEMRLRSVAVGIQL